MQFSAVQCSVVQCSAVQYCAVQLAAQATKRAERWARVGGNPDLVGCTALKHTDNTFWSAGQCSVVQCSAVQFGAV